MSCLLFLLVFVVGLIVVAPIPVAGALASNAEHLRHLGCGSVPAEFDVASESLSSSRGFLRQGAARIPCHPRSAGCVFG